MAITESYIHPDGRSLLSPQFLTDWPLYHTIKNRITRRESAGENGAGQIITVNTLELAEWLERSHIAFDAYCVSCQKETPFFAPADEASKIAAARALRIGTTAPRHGIYSRFFNCRRCSDSYIYVVTRQDAQGLTKIGQSPSASDLTLQSISDYEKALGKEKAGEMIRASVAATFGFSIGAFVYARRVFEHLIDKAEVKAKDAGIVPKHKNSGAHPPMWERIENISDFLPSLLVKHAHMYGVLSEGIHGLTEEKCAEYFPIIREGIELILHQSQEREAREASEKRFSAEMAAIQGDISKTGNPNSE